MNIGLSVLNNIGNNYSYKLNSKEVLVYEDDELRTDNRSDFQKTQDKNEKLQDKNSNPSEKLSDDEKKLVIDLQSRDMEVRSHEAAHQGGGGGVASYSYQQGPDGKMYAIGGEVSIELKTGSTPEETIANAQQVIAAATAPANPSAQDMAVAASAKSIIIKAQQIQAKEMLEQTHAQNTYKDENNNKEKRNLFAKIDISA